MTELNIQQLDFEKGDGLVPAIIQDAETAEVLMLGYMNRSSLEETQSGGEAVFYSRSRQQRWKKGETSGHRLLVQSIAMDCDADTLLLKVRPLGPVCHNGWRTCFGEKPVSRPGILEQLEAIVNSRLSASPEESYTVRLLQSGASRVAQKVGEEAVELAIAAQYENSEQTVAEASDLLYHLMVLLRCKGIGLEQVRQMLKDRQ